MKELREAMENYIQQKRQTTKKLSFIGVGNSGRRDIAEKHENLLWKEEPKLINFQDRKNEYLQNIDN